ncbi:hypothetical protein ABN535_001531 [Campylobacter upsaliensis]|nr:hypothetical protein [Campylobacter upsaliensis]
MYKVKTSKQFDKFLAKHQDIQAKANHYRLRISKYRFLYEVLESEILIYAYKADSRGDIYK